MDNPPARTHRIPTLTAAAIATAMMLLAPSLAAGRVVHTRGGHFLGIVAKTEALTPLAAPGPASTATAASGDAARADASDPYPLPASYQTLIDRFFTDVQTAGQASANDNTYAVSNQYGSSPTAAYTANHYSPTFGRDLSNAGGNRDTDPFPADGLHGNDQGCDPAPLTARQSAGGDPPYGWCVTDAQIQTELGRLIAAGGLPTDNSAVYFVFLPPGVDVCGGPGARTSGNPCGDTDFCAYHSSVGMTTGPLYAVMPWADITDCQSGNHPNADPADDTINVTSHEHIETITDPFATSWITPQGNEIGDLCAAPDVFGSPLGGTPGSPASPGTAYNQVIGGDHYYLQDEFADVGTNNFPIGPGTCQQRPANSGDGPSSPTDPGPLVNPGGGPVIGHHAVYSVYWYPGATPSPPSAAFAASTAAARPGDPVAFNASASTDPQGQPLSYSWDFGDGSMGSGVAVSHAYSTPGDHVVTLTVQDSDRFSGSTTHSLHIFTPPAAAFSVSPAAGFAGQPVAFDAGSSGGPEAPITTYAWSFGDGGAGSGVHTSHAYKAPGVYTVTLTVTDAHGVNASATQPVTLAPAPAATIAASGSRGAKRAGGGVLVLLGRKLTCPQGASCIVDIKLTAGVKTRAKGGHRSRTRTYTIGTARIAVAGGRAKALSLALNAQGRSLLKRLRRLSVTAQIGVSGTGVASTRTTLRFRISQPASSRRKR